MLRAPSAEEKDKKCKEWIAALEKEIEPLLADASPFFGGSEQLTFAEVMTAPGIIRWRALAADGELIPKGFGEALDALPNVSKWAKAIEGKESVMKIFDAQASVEGVKKLVKKMQGGK